MTARRDVAASRIMAIPSLFGALAVLGGASSLSPLLDGFSWIQPAALVVAVIYLVGVGIRAAGAPAWVAELGQVAGFLSAVTALFTESGIAGFLPGVAAWREGGAMLGLAWQQILVTVPPAPVTNELALIITLAVGLVALIMDLIIAGAQIPAMSAIPLLALYSVPAAIAHEMLPWYAFVLPAACYVAVLATSRVEQGAHRRATPSTVTAAVMIAAAAIGAAIIITNASTSIGTAGRISGIGQQASTIGLSPWARLRGELTADDPVPALDVDGTGQPRYLRTMALESWRADEGFGLGAVRADIPEFDGQLGDVADTDESATISPLSFRDSFLPLYANTVQVSGLGSGWSYDVSLQTAFRGDPVTPAPYTITSGADLPSADLLRTEEIAPHAAADLFDVDGIPQSVIDLAQSITAGGNTPFDKVGLLLDYFTDPATGFTYSLSVPAGNSGSALLDFLTAKRGYCEQYAAAMAAMTRAVGIPARIGIGFTQGEAEPDGSYRILSTDAHAWVEVPFEGSGWVTFDPTPAIPGRDRVQGFDEAAAPVPDSPAETSSAATSAPPTQSPTVEEPVLPSDEIAAPTTALPSPAATTSSRSSAPLVIGGAVLLLAAATILAPTAIRRRRRTRRLRAAATGNGIAAWQEISDTAKDHCITFAPAQSIRTRARTLAAQADLGASVRIALDTVVVSAETALYDRYDEPLADGHIRQSLEREVHIVTHAVSERRGITLLDRWLPRSLRRR